jgi:lipoprotein-anchoring transpeptidase ErfK/SrfK
MRQFAFVPLALLIAVPVAAPAAADPWAGVRVAQSGPHVIHAPRVNSRTMRDYERTPVGRPDFAGAPPARQPDFGGGFIEFLFTGRTSSPYAGQLPRAGYMRPQYDMRPQYEYDRRDPYPGRPLIQARREQPDVGARPQSHAIDSQFLPQRVAYDGREKPGTIVIDSKRRFLYMVEEGGMATRYGVGVGRDGFGWSGVKSVTAKREWPDWRPPEEMLKRRPDLPRYMAGGPDNPLGARALYLGDSLYRIHGSNEPWTIGQAVSSGCFRMRNEDVTELYERVKVGTKVVVL